MAKREQYQHRKHRLENRIRDCTKGDRKKRPHRLIVCGAAGERVVSEVRGLSQAVF